MFAQQLAVSGGQAIIVMQIYSALDGKNALDGWALEGLGYTV